MSAHSNAQPQPKRHSILDLAPLELHCMNALWALGEGSVRDIREALVKNRQSGLAGRNMKPHLGHESNQSDGLDDHGLASGVRSAHDQNLSILIELERDGYRACARFLQHVL